MGSPPGILAIHLVRENEFVLKGEPFGDIDRKPAVMLGITWTVGGHCDGPIPERTAGGVRQIRTVDASASNT